MPGRSLLFCGMLALVLTPSHALAQSFIAPYIGYTFNPSTGADGEAAAADGYVDDKRFTYGGSIGALGSVMGFELDFSYTPQFFGDKDAIGDNNVTTVMFNALIGGGSTVRPYVAGGVGLLKLRLAGPGDLLDFDSRDFGMNVGGGLIGFFSNSAGLRGDIRYFRNLTDPEPDDEIDVDLGDFSYWRGTVGLVLRF